MSFSSYLLEVGSLNLLNLSNVKTTRIIFLIKYLPNTYKHKNHKCVQQKERNYHSF